MIYESGALLLPELAHLGYHQSTAAEAQALGAHRHPGVLEICHLQRGVLDWWAGHEVHHLTPGRAYLIMPGEVHGGRDDALHACELRWVQVRLKAGRALPGLPRELTDRLLAMRHRMFVASPAIHMAMDDLLAEHRVRGPLSRPMARAALHRLVLTLLRDHDRRRRDRRPHRAVAAATRHMLERLDAEVRVADVAHAAGLSPTHLHRLFAAELGLTPKDWLNRQRIARARQRLADSDDPITTVAMRLGFATSQYFATTFKRLVGETPTAYRRRVRRG
jgi:AraC-like DNA-binding protein